MFSVVRSIISCGGKMNKHFTKAIWGKALSLLTACSLLLSTVGVTPVFATQSDKDNAADNNNLAFLAAKCLDAKNLKLQKDPHTDKLHFVGAKSGKPIKHPDKNSVDASPEEAARGYLKQCGSLFGVQDEAMELKTRGVKDLEHGRSTVRFQQSVNDIPVLGGEIVMQMDADKNISSIVSELTDATLDNTIPSVDADSATQTALEVVAEKNKLEKSVLSASTPELWFYDPTLLDIDSGHAPALVWRLEVRAEDKPINELVLVDAQTKTILLHFNQMDASWISTDENHSTQAVYVSLNAPAYTLGSPLISIYTLDHTYNELPGSLVCDQSNPVLCNGDSDAQAAYQYMLDTYNFYANIHARDGIDGLGMEMISSVHYGSNVQNAYWNGSQMLFGDGWVADDVVAHEFTHGVTENESALIYYGQSGAINESFSDMWGEFVDQTNIGGTDGPAYDWQVGEDISGDGAIRDMEDPTTFDDPDRTGSSSYYHGAGDNAGVHTNGGVNNKAAYLMAAGGAFNGYTITGIGIEKTAKVYYEAQTNLLTSAATYIDLYNALNQACGNLEFLGIVTTDDCTQVDNAVLAVEMDVAPVPPPAPDNDNFVDAISIAATPYTDAQDTVSATTETGDPYLSCVPTDQGTNSVWYSYVPSEDGMLTVDTFGSNYDTVLAVWTGNFGALVNHGCQDDNNGTQQSELKVSVTSGRIYYIEAVGWDASGSLTFHADIKAGLVINNAIEKISYAYDGGQGNGNSYFPPSVSDDGRYIAFRSDASNIVFGDTNYAPDIFIHDRLTGINQRVSVSSTNPVISGNGRYVAFISSMGFANIYLKDIQSGEVYHVSHSYNGTTTFGSSYAPSVSYDGRYVVFSSSATNLVSNDTNFCEYSWTQNCADVFLWDRNTNIVTRISVSSEGEQANGASDYPKISPNGRYVAFLSVASNLIAGDTNGIGGLFIHDLQTSETYRISEGNGYGDFSPDFSYDGRYIAFYSGNSTIVANDTNEYEDVFVYDQEVQEYTRVSVSSNGTQGNGNSTSSVSISSDGRFVVFRSDASNLVSNDSNAFIACDQYDTGIAANCPDIFLHDRQTGETILLSVASDGTQGDNWTFGADISGDATTVAFESLASTLVPGDTNGAFDIFVRSLDPVKVLRIVRANTNPTDASIVNFIITFSEDVTGVDVYDFVLNTNVTGAFITGMSGSGTTYTVIVNTGSGSGTIRLDIPDTATVTDLADNSLVDLPFTSGETYTIIESSTFISTGARDGWVLESTETSNKGGSMNSTTTTLRLGDDAAKKQYRGILSFSTKGLPDDAVITKVTLKVRKQGITGGGNPVTTFKGFMVDIKKDYFGTTALQTADFQTAASKTYGPFKTVISGVWYNIDLTGGKSYINKLTSSGGLTQIRLRFYLDDNNNTTANYLSLYSGNAGSAYRPQLVIEYYVP
jgi:Zn-dependent metalloprotease